MSGAAALAILQNTQTGEFPWNFAACYQILDETGQFLQMAPHILLS